MPQALSFDAVPRCTDICQPTPAVLVRCKQPQRQTCDNLRPPPKLQTSPRRLGSSRSACHAEELPTPSAAVMINGPGMPQPRRVSRHLQVGHDVPPPLLRSPSRSLLGHHSQRHLLGRTSTAAAPSLGSRRRWQNRGSTSPCRSTASASPPLCPRSDCDTSKASSLRAGRNRAPRVASTFVTGPPLP